MCGVTGGSYHRMSWADDEFEPLPTSLPGLRRVEHAISHKESSDDELVDGMDRLDVSSDECESEYESSDTYNPPEHACRYCELADPECVAKCSCCSKWFCNRVGGSGGSHLLHHLVRSRHKEISLHPDSALGDAVLECYNCGCRNIFLLGFIPAKADTVVVLLCRSPCAASGEAAGQWDVQAWQPLISGRALLPWLLKTETGVEAYARRCRHVSAGQMQRLEEAWRSRPEATLEDLEEGRDVASEDSLPTVKNRYEDGFEYQSTMAPLIQAEAEYDRMVKESQRLEGVTIRWEGLNEANRTAASSILGPLAFFSLPRAEELRITLGDELVLKHPYKPGFTATGCIIRTPTRTVAAEELCVEIRSFQQQRFAEDGGGFTVEFVWKATSYDRMQAALRTFAIDPNCVEASIRSQLLGHEASDGSQKSVATTVKSMSAPGLPALNHSQALAVQSVLGRPLSLIQGPPGTGKTVTSATIVYHLASLNQGPILVTAPSNVAVDHLTEKIHQSGLRVVRIAARWREDVDTQVSFLSLHEQLKNYPAATGKGGLRKAEQDILRAAQVICVTCVGAGDARLKGIKFRAVLLDEATQAVEAEAMIPIVHGAKQLVLIGDHRQLGPVVMSKPAARAGLSTSLFERLINTGIRPIRLQVQYRMHPCLSEWPSNAFYEGSLQNGVTVGERLRPGLDFPWPNPDTPMFFLVGGAQEEISASGTSYLNRMEATQCEKMVTRLLRAGILPSQIGVITPYDGQRAFIQQHMQLSGSLRKDLYLEVEVASVDAFQGREKDYIILSCVRSNDQNGIGFLADARRLNVALTRAKYGLVVLGNPRVLSRHPLWYDFIQHFRERGLLMEGSLHSLRPSVLQLIKPRSRTVDSVSAKQEKAPAVDMERSALANPLDPLPHHHHHLAQAFLGGPMFEEADDEDRQTYMDDYDDRF